MNGHLPLDIRSAGDFSLEALTEVYNRSRIDYIVPMPMSVQRMADYIRTYDVDLSRSAVVLAGDEPLGLAMLGVREGRTWITRMGIIPAKRRRGLGRKLMQHLIHESRQLHAHYILLEVIEGNEPAHRLFRRFDFQETRTLLILRRPPIPLSDPAPTRGELIRGEAALDLLRRRRSLPSWLDETPSLRNAGAIHALQLQLPEGSGWVLFQLLPHQLQRLVLQVESGEPTHIARALLHALHSRYPHHDTKLENLPADSPYLPAFIASGYLVAFRRIEMIRKLSYCR